MVFLKKFLLVLVVTSQMGFATEGADERTIVPVVQDFLTEPNTPSERGMLKTMKDINNAALNKAISDVVNKLLGAVIFISVYYACYGVRKGGKALRDFLVS